MLHEARNHLSYQQYRLTLFLNNEYILEYRTTSLVILLILFEIWVFRELEHVLRIMLYVHNKSLWYKMRNWITCIHLPTYSFQPWEDLIMQKAKDKILKAKGIAKGQTCIQWIRYTELLHMLLEFGIDNCIGSNNEANRPSNL